MSEVLTHQPIGESCIIRESGLATGNVDPRFGDIQDVSRARSEVLRGLVESADTYVIVPKSLDGFVDVDTGDDRITNSLDFPQKNVHADALVTRRSDIGLMLNPADCVPLVMHDSRLGILSLSHLGWKGASLRLHEKVLAYAQEQYGTKPEDIRAYIGPSISPENYITDKLSDAQENDPTWKPFATENNNGFHIDVPGFVIATLVNRGINQENIRLSSADTGSRGGSHFSFTRHKRDGIPDGRNGFVTVMR